MRGRGAGRLGQRLTLSVRVCVAGARRLQRHLHEARARQPAGPQVGGPAGGSAPFVQVAIQDTSSEWAGKSQPAPSVAARVWSYVSPVAWARYGWDHLPSLRGGSDEHHLHRV